MRQTSWNRRKRLVPAGVGFTGADIESNLNAFFSIADGNKKLWERLHETRDRLPWLRGLIDSLTGTVESKGELTGKQKSLATSLYIDSCTMTDEKIAEQVKMRKVGYRLMTLGLGRANKFIGDVMFRTNTRSLSLAQMRAMNDVAVRVRTELQKVPKLTDEDFDGWFKKS